MLIGDFNAKLKIMHNKINQQASRNGRCLQDLIDETETVPVSTKEEWVNWTRVNRKNPDERSVIDYILTHKHNVPMIKNIDIDKLGTHPIKKEDYILQNGETKIGTQTDHNTIIVDLNVKVGCEATTRKVWKINNDTQWGKFNEYINTQDRKKEIKSYDELEEVITNALKKTIGKKTITIGGKTR